MKWKKERQEIVNFARKIYRKGFVTGISGNLSIRVNDNYLLITPKSKCYEKIKTFDIVLIDLNGKIIEGEREPSSEKKLHIEIYKTRKDVKAIIHTHSTYACILAAKELSLPVILDEQKDVLGGEIKVAKYAPCCSNELAYEAVKALENKKGVILAKHGAVTVGKSINEAFYICELLERLSKIYVYIKLIEKTNSSPDNSKYSL